VRSDETPHGIDGGGVPLTSDGVTRPRIVAARRPPRSVYSSGFRKRMASPRHDRSSVTKPSRASSYSKSDDRAPSRAWSRPPRAVTHQRRTQVVEVAAGRGQGPSEGHFHPWGRFTSAAATAKRPDFGGMPWATPPSIKTLPDPRGDAEGPSCQRTGWLRLLGPFPPSFLARPVSLKTPLVTN